MLLTGAPPFFGSDEEAWETQVLQVQILKQKNLTETGRGGGKQDFTEKNKDFCCKTPIRKSCFFGSDDVLTFLKRAEVSSFHWDVFLATQWSTWSGVRGLEKKGNKLRYPMWLFRFYMSWGL